MIRFFTGVIFFCFYCLPVIAQRDCGTIQYNKEIRLANAPGGVNSPSTIQRDTTPNEIINIPVIIHLMYKTSEQNISDAQIRSQLDALNRDYRMMNTDNAEIPSAFKPFAADGKIMFCLAQVDPSGRSSRGIIRKYTERDYFSADDAMKFSAAGGDDAWDSKKYLNIWVCNLFGRTLGYASIPGSETDKDGVVISWDAFGTIGNLRPSFNKGRTATHEVGHWLGLKHLWGDAICGDDGIDDTPSQQNYNFGCPSFPRVSTCSPNQNGDMFMNFMDFTDDACMHMFTQGQKKKMRSLFAIDGSRNSFLNSFACDSMLATGGPVGDLPPKAAVSIKIYPNPTTDFVHIDGLERDLLNILLQPYIQYKGNHHTLLIDKYK